MDGGEAGDVGEEDGARLGVVVEAVREAAGAVGGSGPLLPNFSAGIKRDLRPPPSLSLSYAWSELCAGPKKHHAWGAKARTSIKQGGSKNYTRYPSQAESK